jgi:RNA polymerase sigma factor (sigma-70 family)
MFHEKEVIANILKGDRRAFKLLVQQYEHLVFHVAGRVVRGQEDIEDICQEVFLKVYKNLSRFSFQSKLSTWIAQITYFTAISYVKKYKKELASEYPESLNHFHFTSETPEQLTMEKDVSGYVERLVLQLP